ncbi:enoyl-CoA hydratase/isomerase family protein [Nocardioides sp.]|uniref:enoyl-CoA hydratase/isomerase family protein n=1 Tax=Nocardioides sp. TaxID=35761 RepID=UPI0035B4DE35
MTSHDPVEERDEPVQAQAGRHVLVQVDSATGVATIQLNRPPMNPFDDDMRDALIHAVRDVADDDSIRVCLVHGGENFAAGADIKALAAMGYEQISSWNARLHGAFTAVAELPMPVVAAIEGYALGGGLELALAADIRIGARDCSVGLPEVKLGILPGSGGTQRLTQIVGRSTAKLLIMSGRRLAAQEAHSLGLLDEVTEPGQSFARALELAHEIAQSPSYAIRAIKACVDAAAPLAPSGFALERALLAGMFATEDRSTAMSVFLNRRRTS